MLNRPSVIELESTDFDSFLGDKARARRKARKEGRLSQGSTLYSAVDPLVAGGLPQDSGIKPNKPMPRFKDKESMLAWLKVNDPEKYAQMMEKEGSSSDSSSTLKSETTEDDTTESGGGINKTYLIVGVLALAGIIYYVTKKKK